MIKEKSKVTNWTERRLRREAEALAIVKGMTFEQPAPVFVPFEPPKPDATYTFWRQPNDTFPMGSIVYFMYSAGRIKIGFSSGLRDRQKSLRSAGPFPPIALLVMNGSEQDEKKMHRQFAADRLHGEWFSLSAGIRSFLRSRLCDIGRASLERAEAEFRDYCASFLEGYKSPPKRRPRQNCPHGKPAHQSCYPCERERDLAILETLRQRENIENIHGNGYRNVTQSESYLTAIALAWHPVQGREGHPLIISSAGKCDRLDRCLAPACRARGM